MRKITPIGLNKVLEKQRVPCEFSRRTRGLGAGLKAEELRNLGLFHFPIVLEELQSDATKLVWALAAYLLRAYCCVDEELAATTANKRRDLTERMISAFVRAFGENAATYNLHSALHLERLRELGPLPGIYYSYM
ncbi:MAG: hypothetical protein COB97_01355 [Paracoccus sp.]|nr:MAG: hypothetical protein COB97_01355 [Paracoccus sp. (in: a-proteobacteria)]